MATALSSGRAIGFRIKGGAGDGLRTRSRQVQTRRFVFEEHALIRTKAHQSAPR